jgi:DNA-binding HxlR family transcriptional regulator
MRGYGQFCPVALGAEVFAERWTPLILRELLAGSHRSASCSEGCPASRVRCWPSGWDPCSEAD